MKRTTCENGNVTYVFEHKTYTITITVVEDKITTVLAEENGNYVLSGDVRNDKYPNGLPNTSYNRIKVKDEIEGILNELSEVLVDENKSVEE